MIMYLLSITFVIASAVLYKFYVKRKQKIHPIEKSMPIVPLSVNFHFTRKCNYECGFCFHTAKTSDVTNLEEAKRGLSLLKSEGMRKLNFSGGEPFLYHKYLGELVKFSKENLKLESISVVSNGSKINEAWFKRYSQYLDILAISVDSFNEETNIKIGRGNGTHLNKLTDIRDWCEKYNVMFKLNSVVCTYNWEENMIEPILNLRPFRWKVFQCLLVDTENAGKEAIRKAETFVITDEQYEYFCSKHCELDCFVPESNALMKSSYIILDEYMRFLNKGDVYAESESILKVGVQKAMQQIDFDINSFTKRGGVYDWSKNKNLTSSCNDSILEW